MSLDEELTIDNIWYLLERSEPFGNTYLPGKLDYGDFNTLWIEDKHHGEDLLGRRWQAEVKKGVDRSSNKLMTRMMMNA